MAMKNCFQVSSVSTTRAGVCPPFSPVEKLQLPACKGLNASNLSLSSPSSSFPRSLRSRTQESRIVCKAREAVDAVQVATDASWDTVIGSDNPCSCGVLGTMVRTLQDDSSSSRRNWRKNTQERLACYKVNTDDCPDIATKYGIRSIPTVLFFKKGEKKESVIGAVPKTTLSNSIDKYIEA
uniref:Thioredoxin domain-containing protein n=1 Tax=Salix viminalis TaxID=40686 RepID=A0A6N2MA53_SALVM